MDKIESFLLKFQSNSTQQVYRTHLKQYFDMLNVDADKYFDKFERADKSKKKAALKNVLKEYENDVIRFWQSMKKRPPLSIRNAISCVKMFLLNYDVELKTKFWKDISNRTQGSRPVTKDIVPTREQLKELLTHADSRGRALFLILSSSGMRIGEACKITCDDVKLDEKPVRIEIQGEYTKSGNERDVFISNEATTALKAWLKIRQDYLNSSEKHASYRFTHYEICKDDIRVFPFRPDAGRVIWNQLISKSKYAERDKRTGRYRMHVHTLRKYFRTNMSLKIPVDVVEVLMGHEGYLTSVYRRYSLEQLRDFYSKGMETISVFETPADLSRIEDLEHQLAETTKEKDEQIQELTGKLSKFEFDLSDVKEIAKEFHAHQMREALKKRKTD